MNKNGNYINLAQFSTWANNVNAWIQRWRATILLLLTSTSQAANFATLDELRSQVKTVYTEQKYCPSECIAIDGFDLETVDLKEVLIPVCTTNDKDETTCVDKPSGQFELKESLSRKLAKEAKQKQDADAATQAQEAKKTRQTEIKALAEKSGNLTATEIQRLLKALAQEIK